MAEAVLRILHASVVRPTHTVTERLLVHLTVIHVAVVVRFLLLNGVVDRLLVGR